MVTRRHRDAERVKVKGYTGSGDAETRRHGESEGEELNGEQEARSKKQANTGFWLSVGGFELLTTQDLNQVVFSMLPAPSFTGDFIDAQNEHG